MTIRSIRAAVLAAGLALVGCGGSPETQSDETAPAASTPAASDSRPAAFAQCVACHSVEPGKNGIGPSLAGVFGRAAATGPGFAYSSALKRSGLTWDEATLDRWLTAPMRTVPGTRMAYPGLRDASERAAVIDYLKTLS